MWREGDLGHYTLESSCPPFSCNVWVWHWDSQVTVPSRNVQTWTYSGSGWRWGEAFGDASCQRSHIAFSRNQ